MYYYIAFNSITFANRIKNYFRYDGDYVGVMHTPSQFALGGCSYSVKVKPAKLQQVLAISEEFEFKIKAVFKQTDDGQFIEVKL